MSAVDAPGSEEQEYILGTDQEELDRLRFQHEVWRRHARDLWQRAGLQPGHAVLDLGCGPGFTSFDLARAVGPNGSVIARDVSARFLAFLAQEKERLGLPQIETSEGAVEQLDLPAGSLDAAYARWLLCWVEQPLEVLRRTTHALRGGGMVLLQDYLDWGALKLVPHSSIGERVVEACLESWRGGEATINIAERMPTLAAQCGLRIEEFRPVARLGRVGSAEWQWVGQFLTSYAPKLATRGLLTDAERDAFLTEWAERTEDGGSYCTTPTMADMVLRKSSP